jgi:diguanylate cyclase (GGDEF)-like protein
MDAAPVRRFALSPRARGAKPSGATLATVVTRAGGGGPVATTSVGSLAQFLEDPLTGLGSLLTLRRDLELIVDRHQPFGTRPALLLIDVDGFARVNAHNGRAAGDQVLRATADRLRALLPPGDQAYRTGGDEFMAVLRATPMIEAVSAAGRVLETLSQPVLVDGRQVPVSVSVAVVMLGHRTRVDALLRDADVTMYRAKAEGGRRVDLYNWEVDGWSNRHRRDVGRLEAEIDELRRQNQILKEALTLDLPTGLPNATAFEADHQQVAALHRRSSEPYSILRVRVDGITDGDPAWATPEGRGALQEVARSVRATVLRSDRAYVLGPGDLAVLLRGSGLEQAVAAADQIRAGVGRLALRRPGPGDRTLSVTVAAVEAGGSRHPGAEEALTEVEGLLHQAMAAGGDRSVGPG